ncbi:hypothetical protein GGH94_005584 [Coemansia aciculifera]|uniref:Nucleolar pre-ribosomal-associated protein 1 C-terminal domain-containing protein n=1 Tax=Coemansia aciculifera TaxID=417176 RepID=A0A9W8M457_9FUNG|nr:hypothetical protein GGH94_005584 [Coemansia aciculifera]
MGKSKDAKETKRRRAEPAAEANSEEEEEEVVAPETDLTDIANYEKDAQISFKSSDDIVRALSASNADLLIQGFTHLREHVKICNRKTEGDSAEVQSLRESCRRVVYEWAEQSHEFEGIAAAWQFALSNSVPRLDGLIPSVISGLLLAFDSPTTHKYGSQLIRLVLDGFMRAVYRAFNTPRSSACASILQMLYQIVVYSQGEHADQLRHSFDWTQKSLAALPMTRSNMIGFSVRRLWIRFVLSFFSVERCKTFNQLLGARKVIGSLFLGVEKDTYQELHTLLESVFASVVLNEEITRSDKARVFGIQLVGNLVKAGQNAQDISPQLVGIERPALFVPGEATSVEPLTTDSMAGLVTRFLRGLMAFPGHGICFKQYGLYTPPRRLLGNDGATDEADGDMHDVATFTKNSSSSEMQDLCNSQILRILVVCINPSMSKHMSSLAIDIMRASPELIAPFWRNYHCSFEPRLSLSYLRNTGFAIKVMSLPLPVPQESEARYSVPPRLNTLVEHITPYPLDPMLVGRGLSTAAAPLVRYRNMLLVDMALRKLGDARAWIRAEARAAGGDANKWIQLDQRLLAVVKQRIPQCKHIVSIHQHLLSLTEQGTQVGDDLREAECQHAVFSNALMRVMSGYQAHFGELVLEAHFEFGTLISGIYLPDVVSVGKRVTERIRNPMNAHTLLYLLHALSTTPAALVKWMTRVKSSESGDTHTYLGVILMVYLFAVQPELRLAARAVAVGALQSTGLFDHDASGEEAKCWLDALMLASPHAGRNTRLSFIADGGIAKGQGLVSFLEDAVLLSSKLPYKYADRIHASAPMDDDRLPFSPLLSAIVEAAILKLAFGAKSQGSNWREASQERIAGEMRTTDMCGFVSEVVCRVSESRGVEATRRLSRFVVMAADLTLAPRIAKLDADKNPQKVEDEKRYCAKIESAFAETMQGTVDYLLTAAAGVVTTQKPTAIGNGVGSAVDAQLKRELASACANIEDRLSELMTQLALALREHGLSVSAITEWLLEQARVATGGERQAVCIATITWISAYHRVSPNGHSLWDMPAFVALAPEILQIDDTSFLLSMFRHLLGSKSLVALVSDNIGVQRLLAHVLLANKGSSQFGLYAVQLVRCLATQAPDGSKALSFAFALIYEHMASIDDGTLPVMIEQYSRSLCPFMLDTGSQSVLDYNLSVLARRSAQIWTSPLVASKTWHSLLMRMETALSVPDIPATHMVYLLSLLCVASPAASENSRSELIRMLAEFARAQHTQDAFCAAATAVFSLLNDSPSSGLESLEHVRSAKAYLSSKVIGMWLSSLGSTDVNSDEELLEHAARLATGSRAITVSSAGSLELARARLPRFGQTYALDTAVDATGGALSHLWQRAADKSSYACDQSRRDLLARIVSADDRLRVSACEWVGRMLESPAEMTGHRMHYLAGLLRAMSVSSMHETEGGRITWDGSSSSQLLSSMCLKLGACLLAGSSRISARISEMAADSDLLFVANAFIQGSEDSAVIDTLRRKLVKSTDTLTVRATLLRSMVLRSALFPEQIDAGLDSFAALAGIIQLSDDMSLTSVLASAMEHCVQFAKSLANVTALNAKKAVLASFRSIDALTLSICVPFDQAESLSAEELHTLVEQYPVSVYRLLAFMATATYSIVSAAGLQPDPELRWFAVLRRLFDCRLFGDRMQVAGLCDLLSLTVSGLWDLAKPSLSRWSASLDDYLSLDQLECLMGAYGGTRSLSDMVLLRVIGDYEQTTRQSIQRVALAFGPTAATTYVKERISRNRYAIERDENDIGVVGEDTLSNALLAVDSGKLFRTVLNFPVNQYAVSDSVSQLLTALSDDGGDKPGLDVYDSSLVYDPQFMLAWVWTLVSARVQVDIRRLFECNAAGLALVALSSADPRTRKLAYYILDILYARVADAKNLSGQRQYILLLDALRNAIVDRNEAEFPRIPFAITIFVATSLNVMMHPEHAMFADVNQLLLRRPYLRLSDIPLLRSVLRSSANVRKQRTHVLRQAAQSARAFDLSLAAFKNADFVNVTLVLASNPLGDVLTSRAALTLLFHLTGAENPKGLALHVSRHNSFVLPWIRQQVALEVNSLVEASSRAKLDGESAGSAGGLALLMQPALAALGNLTALMRVVLRAIANYPLSVLSDGTLLHDRFWVVQSATQVSAPGQTIAITIVSQILQGLASSLQVLDGSSVLEFSKSALILLRTCVDSARLLSDMQMGASDQQPPILRAPEISRNALLCLRVLEPTTCAYSLRYDTCSAVSVAKAQFSESLFCNDVVVCRSDAGSYACYRLCIESLLRWCLDAPWSTCSLGESVDIIGRAIVAGVRGAVKAKAWIRDAQLMCVTKDEHALNDKLQVLALSQ